MYPRGLTNDELSISLINLGKAQGLEPLEPIPSAHVRFCQPVCDLMMSLIGFDYKTVIEKGLGGLLPI